MHTYGMIDAGQKNKERSMPLMNQGALTQTGGEPTGPAAGLRRVLTPGNKACITVGHCSSRREGADLQHKTPPKKAVYNLHKYNLLKTPPLLFVTSGWYL